MELDKQFLRMVIHPSLILLLADAGWVTRLLKMYHNYKLNFCTFYSGVVGKHPQGRGYMRHLDCSRSSEGQSFHQHPQVRSHTQLHRSLRNTHSRGGGPQVDILVQYYSSLRYVLIAVCTFIQENNVPWSAKVGSTM